MLKKCPANYLVCHDRKNEVRAVRKNKQTQLAQMLEFFSEGAEVVHWLKMG